MIWSYFLFRCLLVVFCFNFLSPLYIFFPEEEEVLILSMERGFTPGRILVKNIFSPIIEYDRIHPSNTMIRLF